MSSPVVQRPLLSFFVLANLFSWMAWAPLAATGLGAATIRLSPYLHLVGGLGPMVAAMLLTLAGEGRVGVARFLQRGFAVRDRLGWIAFGVAAPVPLFAGSVAGLHVAGEAHVVWTDVGKSVEYPALGRGVYWVANVLFYGLGEEVGWRGFALPRLKPKEVR
jgi:membrane protease YdiL (CAAX protease family)